MDWLKNHADTIVILYSLALCFWTLNEKINKVDKELAIIKTVLIIKNIIPNELFLHSKEQN